MSLRSYVLMFLCSYIAGRHSTYIGPYVVIIVKIGEYIVFFCVFRRCYLLRSPVILLVNVLMLLLLQGTSGCCVVLVLRVLMS